MMTDPVADMLTRIRNAVAIDRKTVSMPSSKLKVGIAETLKREGYIDGFAVGDETPQPKLSVTLRYDADGQRAISKIDRVSKPGRRIYKGVNDLPIVLSGLGIAIVSTSRGVRSDRECRIERLGGEVIAVVY